MKGERRRTRVVKQHSKFEDGVSEWIGESRNLMCKFTLPYSLLSATEIPMLIVVALVGTVKSLFVGMGLPREWKTREHH